MINEQVRVALSEDFSNFKTIYVKNITYEKLI